jgi:single-stranded-DNA-specific exonuclease
VALLAQAGAAHPIDGTLNRRGFEQDLNNMTPRIVARTFDPAHAEQLALAGIPPVLARIYAARSLSGPDQLDTGLCRLLAPEMKGLAEAATLLADAIVARERMLIVADYDADGATACAVGVRALRAMGAIVDYLVPRRLEDGYGLTPEIARQAAARQPDMLITVDNGIASVDGVAEANRLGMRVIVTDHHHPGAQLPDAAAIVNPNQADCAFASKCLAGVGVIFYLMLALRAELRRRAWFASVSGLGRPDPNLAALLDIVALGTVADVVPLDHNNRILVAQGLARIRAGRAHAGIAALLRMAGREATRASTYDLGFVVGPRLNAAGRLTDMSLGIECLITDDTARAQGLAAELDRLNRERRDIEGQMQESALERLEDVDVRERCALVLFDPEWHQGVVGLLASRLKDRYHRTVLAFAAGKDGELKGSGRAIRGLHLRDALDLVAKRHPRLLRRFGGHAAAAGVAIAAADFHAFAEAFEQVVRSLLRPEDLAQIIETDGELAPSEATSDLARTIDCNVWGQGFAAPRFDGWFNVENQRVVGERHLKLTLKIGAHTFDAIAFNQNSCLPAMARVVYRPDLNEYNGTSRLQLIIDHWQEPQ